MGTLAVRRALIDQGAVVEIAAQPADRAGVSPQWREGSAGTSLTGA
ncbi:MAG: hypothetical protein U0R19_21490 [Bryobacteraceae bacterium]